MAVVTGRFEGSELDEKSCHLMYYPHIKIAAQKSIRGWSSQFTAWPWNEPSLSNVSIRPFKHSPSCQREKVESSLDWSTNNLYAPIASTIVSSVQKMQQLSPLNWSTNISNSLSLDHKNQARCYTCTAAIPYRTCRLRNEAETALDNARPGLIV
jgi:hypothetical protein